MNTGQFGFEDVDELLEELPETFRSSQAFNRVDVSAKKLGTTLKSYEHQEETELYEVHNNPFCYSRHDLDISNRLVKRGLDILNKAVKIIWEKGEMTEKELNRIKKYADSDTYLTQARMVGEVKDLLDEQHPGIEYNVKEQKFYRDE
jgi:hypothetical protein